ncbi:MAG: zinc ribbon domain-containing protein [Proteobacteria bacterium]|nr:zinc ribbon domain-containing protein [Pseudomonadota bacterium]
MPLFEFQCSDCGQQNEILVGASTSQIECRSCGSHDLKKMLSVPSSLSGVTKSGLPGPGDTACCGMGPDQAGCAGPGSCCGKEMVVA